MVERHSSQIARFFFSVVCRYIQKKFLHSIGFYFYVFPSLFCRKKGIFCRTYCINAIRSIDFLKLVFSYVSFPLDRLLVASFRASHARLIFSWDAFELCHVLSTTIKSMILSLIMLVWRMFSSSKHSISRPREDDKSVHFHYLISASLCCKHSYQQLGCLFRYMLNRTILCLEQIDPLFGFVTLVFSIFNTDSFHNFPFLIVEHKLAIKVSSIS